MVPNTRNTGLWEVIPALGEGTSWCCMSAKEGEGSQGWLCKHCWLWCRSPVVRSVVASPAVGGSRQRYLCLAGWEPRFWDSRGASVLLRLILSRGRTAALWSKQRFHNPQAVMGRCSLRVGDTTGDTLFVFTGIAQAQLQQVLRERRMKGTERS